MIVDCHMYCFPPKDAPAGYPTLEEKLRIIQREEAGHHLAVWRVRDRAAADYSTLIDPDTGELRDVQWRRDELGRLCWVYEGDAYTNQHIPPMLHNLESTPELMIAEMDHAGVDMGVMHTYPIMGEHAFLNRYLREAVKRFPDRLSRIIAVREAAIPEDPEGAAREVEAEVRAGGATGVQFISGFYYQGGHRETWDDGALRPFWQAVAALKLPVFFTLVGGTGGEAYLRSWSDSYIAEQRVLTRWMERYPDLTAVITHGLPWRTYLEGDRIRFPEEIWEVFEAPQCHLQLLIPIQMGNLWEYPWTEAEPTVRECVQRVGAERLMWGTDMPMLGRSCTYRQALDQFRVHCDFLTSEERADILGGTVARVMGVHSDPA